jgi:low temperature requirement protein LtrA
VPGHFAERHGAIVIIALGESIVAIGVGAKPTIGAGIVTAAVLGIVVAAALWWAYFDVVAIVAARRLAKASGRERNELARDSYSYLHFPMIAGIALIAVGIKRTLVHVSDPLALVPAVALLGGAALYLLAHVAFRLRNMHTLNRPRLFCALLLFALVPAATAMSALLALGMLAAVLASLIVYEALRYAEARDRVRHQLAREPVPQPAAGESASGTTGS